MTGRLALVMCEATGLFSEPADLLQPAPSAAEREQPFLQEERKIIYFILCVLRRENVSVTPYIKLKPI